MRSLDVKQKEQKEKEKNNIIFFFFFFAPFSLIVLGKVLKDIPKYENESEISPLPQLCVLVNEQVCSASSSTSEEMGLPFFFFLFSGIEILEMLWGFVFFFFFFKKAKLFHVPKHHT